MPSVPETRIGAGAMPLEEAVRRYQACYDALAGQVARTVVGQEQVVDLLLASLFAGGHVLLEGAPGLGKTLLVRTLASALHLKFSRVQCTPDLMPADIIGTNVLIEDPSGGQRMEFERGPIFANIVLADEVNRATPKSQSAFLEAMEEGRVTVFGTDHVLDQPFLVMATQNPIEMEGTYPLPEAQLDRFLFKLRFNYPDLEGLSRIVDQTTAEVTPVIETQFGASDVLAMRTLVRQVKLTDPVKRYALRVVLASQPESGEAGSAVRQYVRYGAGPRAAQAIILGAKALALAEGRYNVAYEDVRRVVPAALVHRISLNFEGEIRGEGVDAIVRQILDEVPE